MAILRRFLVIAVFFPLCPPVFGQPSPAAGGADPPERPSAMKLFPAESLLLVRTPDARLWWERQQQTLAAKMLRDPEIAPTYDKLYGLAREQYDTYAKERVGLELDELLRLPQGEVAFALVGTPNTTPEALLLVDFGDSIELVDKLRTRLEETQAELDLQVSHEDMDGDDVTVLRRGNDQTEEIGIVQRGNVLVASSDRNLLRSVLARWDGRPVVDESVAETEGEPDATVKAPAPLYQKTLAENPTFVAIIAECVPGQEEPPQLLVYADIIGLIRSNNAKSTAARVGLAMMTPLGLMNLKGIGLTTWSATETWDSLIRGHLLIDNPRSGVLKIARLEAAQMTPPAGVPEGVQSYMTLRVDPMKMFDQIGQIVDQFTTKGNFRKRVEQGPNKGLGLDLEKDLLAHLSGDLSIINAFDREGERIMGGNLFVLGLRDPKAFEESVKKFWEKDSDNLEGEPYAGVEIRGIKVPKAWDGRPDDERPPLPIWAIVGDAFLQSDSLDLLHRYIDTQQGQEPALADSIEYRLIASRVERLAGGRAPSGVMYSNSEEALRHWYGVATGDRARDFLQGERMAEQPFVPKLREMLDSNELPPLEALLRYTAPGGGVVYDTETGFHMIAFGFKREE